MITQKKAAIKRSVHRLLSERSHGVTTIERHDQCTFSIALSTKTGIQYGFDEYDDEGDLSTDAEHDEIYEAVKVIIDEYNQNVA